MSDCNLKWMLIIICLLIALIGLFLAFIREKKNIDQGTVDIQDGSGNFKEGSFTFKFAIGLALIVIGLIGAVYSSQYLHGCEVSGPIRPLQNDTTTMSQANIQRRLDTLRAMSAVDTIRKFHKVYSQNFGEINAREIDVIDISVDAEATFQYSDGSTYYSIFAINDLKKECSFHLEVTLCDIDSNIIEFFHTDPYELKSTNNKNNPIHLSAAFQKKTDEISRLKVKRMVTKLYFDQAP